MLNRTEAQLFEIAIAAASHRRTSHYSASWLLSPFEDLVWKTIFGSRTEIDFRVRLEDGSYLTDIKNKKTLDIFKLFLILQTHPVHTKGIVLSSITAGNRVLSAVHICEYIVDRAQNLKVGEYGLQALSETEARELLRTLATNEVSEGVYRWSERLTVLLKEKGKSLSDAEAAETLESFSFLGTIGNTSRKLQLTNDEIIRARLWLWREGKYEKTSRRDGSLYTLNASLLTAQLYPNGTLKSNWLQPGFDEINFPAGPRLLREKASAPVRGQLRSEHPVRLYSNTLSSLVHLKNLNVSFPLALAHAADDPIFVQELKLAAPGRYRTLPHSIVLKALKNALEFSISHCEELFTSYLNIAKACVSENRNGSIESFLKNNSIESFLTPSVAAMGVRVWNLSAEKRNSFERHHETSIQEAESNFFDSFRRNEGLHELLLVLGGSLLVSLGILMARRQGEITDLQCGDLFDKTGTRLRFVARKPRRALERPIPPVCAKLLGQVQDFQTEMKACGLLSELTNVFSFPGAGKVRLSAANSSLANLMLDRFCDYFSISLNAKGERTYIRQHQLRRFFAMLFFWGNGYAGLDSLRWFLGHTDPRHLWNYITEEIPGDVLRHVAVDYTVERLIEGDAQARSLVDLIEARFCTRNVQLLDADELSLYIDELLTDKTITVEPEFFSTPNGEDYKILISVTRTRHELETSE